MLASLHKHARMTSMNQLQEFSDQVPLFSALADPTRLNVLVTLAVTGTPMTVTELATVLDDVDTSGISRHLKVLREAGAVVTIRHGRSTANTVDYRLLATTLRDIASAIDACCPAPQDSGA